MFYFVRTQNPRPTFHLDMTEDERSLMNDHVAYWSEKAAKGIAVVFGPVMDPHGVYGIGVYRVRDGLEMQALLDGDPAKGLLHYEMFQMPRAIVGTPTPGNVCEA